MSNELAVRQETVKSLLANASYKKRFEEVLGKRAPQFMASISNAAQLPGLAKCEPKSVLAAAFVAATLDLPIDRNLGLAWLIPYKTNIKNGDGWKQLTICQFQMGYKGFVNLAMRSGQYHRLNAFKVNKEALLGHDDCGEVEIDFSKLDETKEAVGYAVVWRLSNGFRKLVYWTKDRVLEHAARFSQGYKQKAKDSPWVKHLDEMSLKTVVKAALSKWGILSVEMRDAIKHDTGAQVDIDADVTPAELLDGETIDAETVEDLGGENGGEGDRPEHARADRPPETASTSSAIDGARTKEQSTSPPAQLTPQQHLEYLITKDWSMTFDHWRKCASENNWLKDADSLGSFSELPLEIAERFLRNKAGMKSQLEKI